MLVWWRCVGLGRLGWCEFEAVRWPLLFGFMGLWQRCVDLWLFGWCESVGVVLFFGLGFLGVLLAGWIGAGYVAGVDLWEVGLV